MRERGREKKIRVLGGNRREGGKREKKKRKNKNFRVWVRLDL